MNPFIPVYLEKAVVLCDPFVPYYEFRKIKNMKLHTAAVSSIRFSANSNFFITGSSDMTFKKIDAFTGKEVWKGKHSGDCVSVNISPDGMMVATVSINNYLIISDFKKGKAIAKIDTQNTNVFAFFLSDGKHVLVGGCYLCLWNIKTKEPVMAFSDPESDSEFYETSSDSSDNSICSGAMSFDESLIVTGHEGGKIFLWDCVTGKCKQVWNGHKDVVFCLYFSKSGKKVLSCSRDTTAILWNVNDGTVIRNFKGHTDFVFSCVLSSDEAVVFTSSRDKTVKLWDIHTGTCIQTICFENQVLDLAISFDDSKIITGHTDGSVSFLQRLPGAIVHQIPLLLLVPPISFFLSLDQSILIVSTEKRRKKNVLVIDVVTHNIIRSVFITDDFLLNNISLDLKHNFAPKNVTLQQYALRCLIVSRILLFSTDSIFANRLKLSVWLAPDVFSDAVAHHSIGLSPAMAKRIVSLSLNEDLFPLPPYLIQKNDFFRYVGISCSEEKYIRMY